MGINVATLRRVVGTSALAGVLFTAGFEGRSLPVYNDPVGVLTACDGHASTGPDGRPLVLGTRYTDEVCDYLLGKDYSAAMAALDRSVSVPLSDGERVAYTDFIFNAGIGSFNGSTMRRKLLADDRVGACNALLTWTKGKMKGKLVVLDGLVKRREAESKACLAGKLS